MKTTFLALMLSLGATTLLPGFAPQEAETEPSGRLIIVKMVDKSTAQWRFEPETVTVTPGDTVRWVQEDDVPHNVEFREVPDDSELGDATMGPFLLNKGDTYDLVIDRRFTLGMYDYVCTAHWALGQTGVLVVASGRYSSRDGE
jgi:plastocyanin